MLYLDVEALVRRRGSLASSSDAEAATGTAAGAGVEGEESGEGAAGERKIPGSALDALLSVASVEVALPAPVEKAESEKKGRSASYRGRAPQPQRHQRAASRW